MTPQTKVQLVTKGLCVMIPKETHCNIVANQVSMKTISGTKIIFIFI